MQGNQISYYTDIGGFRRECTFRAMPRFKWVRKVCNPPGSSGGTIVKA
jgi:hypothetical protein